MDTKGAGERKNMRGWLGKTRKIKNSYLYLARGTRNLKNVQILYVLLETGFSEFGGSQI